MLITPLDAEIYKVPIPSEKDIQKAISLKSNAYMDDYFASLRGFWLIYHEEIKHLNPNKIHNMGTFFSKIKGYRQYKKRLLRTTKRRNNP